MPFTLSHAAAVLPGLRTDSDGRVRGRGRWSAAGLVAGALAPDVPFFLDTLLPGTHRLGRLGHRPVGVVLLDPLIAAALAGGWAVARGPLTALLPARRRPAAARLLGLDAAGAEVGGGKAPRSGFDPARSGAAGWFWLSAATGAASHVALDSFTHAGRWGVRRLPVLDRRVRGVPLYLCAQYAGSAAGLVALARWSAAAARRAPRCPVPVPPPGAGGWERGAGLGAVAAGAVAGGVLRCRRDRPRGAAEWIASALFGAGGGMAPAVAWHTALVRARRRVPR